MDQPPAWQSLCSVLAALFLSYVAFDAAQTKRETRKQASLPLVGAPWLLTPRFVLNARFAWDAAGLLEEGYRKCNTEPFQLVQNDKNIVVLPHHLLQELSSLPSSVASPHGGLERDLLGSYSGLDLVLQTRLHHSVIQRKLTPRLALVTPGLEKELASALQDCIPACEKDWAEFQPYQAFRRVLARLSGNLIISPAFQHKQAWEQLQVDYVENLFATIVVLRLFPAWVRPVISWMLPSYWLCRRSIATAKKLLRPTVQQLLKESDAGFCISQDPGGEHFNILSWLVDSVKGRDRDPDTLMHAMVIVALASLHTVLLRVVNVLYDLTANPDLLDEVRAEMEAVATDPQGWSHSSYEKLHKLDSVIVESQRTSPPTTTGLKRLFREPYTFQNGLHVARGTYVCMPIYAIENDPAHTPHPEVFDGLRQYRLSQEAREGGPASVNNKLQFAYPTPTNLNFGYGKAACPGRFFAGLEIKMVFAKLLTEYDFKFLPGVGRPSNMMVHEFLFTWPWTKMLVRRRQGGVCPF
ncbi:putative cytochrome P450 [Xylaria acuta]|nr:putative cytochrome P450 [Xylaria acuta]